MKDILLNGSGDIKLDSKGDLQFTDSVSQAIAIRLRWFENEWKLGPSLGIPYYEEVFIKNPSTLLLEDRIMEAIYDVDEVDDIKNLTLKLDKYSRTLTVNYRVIAGDEAIEGRLTLDV